MLEGEGEDSSGGYWEGGEEPDVEGRLSKEMLVIEEGTGGS
jgi:hypothetical protein